MTMTLEMVLIETGTTTAAKQQFLVITEGCEIPQYKHHDHGNGNNNDSGGALYEVSSAASLDPSGFDVGFHSGWLRKAP